MANEPLESVHAYPKSPVVAVIGLGYVGLPLAIAFGKIFRTIGFDVDSSKVSIGLSNAGSLAKSEMQDLRETQGLVLTSDESLLAGVDVFVVAVPTPVDAQMMPDLRILCDASSMVGKYLRRGCVVIYESTVYPGTTEEVCVPVLESVSGLAFNVDFVCGYSPERINPGDETHRLENVRKITSGSTAAAAEFVDSLYRRVVSAGTYLAPSIRIAEAAKVVENVQRDVNIALMNELSMMFKVAGVDTLEVLAAAGTKWNFAPYRPGLVGGHCIGVDPYYLTFKATALGYYPELMLAARRINSGMGLYVANRVLRLLAERGRGVRGSRVLVAGLSFKENCADLRNTRVVEIVDELISLGGVVDVWDPLVDPSVGNDLVRGLLRDWEDLKGPYAAIVLAVPHDRILNFGIDRILDFGDSECVVFDVKGALPVSLVTERL